MGTLLRGKGSVGLVLRVALVFCWGMELAWSFSHFKVNHQKLSQKFQSTNEEGPIRAATIQAESTLIQAASSNPTSFQAPEDLTERSPIYQEILDELNSTYESIGSGLVGSVLNKNRSFDLGTKNISGVSWQKPMGSFGFLVDRQLAPHLSSEKWLVTDTFTLYVDASTFLHNMKDEGIIDISETNIAAFAGIAFKRVYRYAHFADSYVEGLSYRLDNLFLSFLKFRGHSIFDLKPQEVMTKEDFFTVKAGALITSPSVYGLSASAGVIAKYKRSASVMVESMSEASNDRLRISMEKKKSVETGINISLQGDFHKLLKITLLRYDFSYELEEGNRLDITFKKSDMDEYRSNSALREETRKLLTLKKANENILRPYIVSKNHSISEILRSELLILLWGRQKKSKTEQIHTVMNDKERFFFKNHTENLKYTKGFFQTLLGPLLKTLKLDKFLFTGYKAAKSRRVTMEYELKKEGGVLPDHKIINVPESEMSVTVTQEYTAQKTHRWYHKKYKKHALHMIGHYSDLSRQVYDAVNGRSLRGPLSIKTTLQINKEGLLRFNRMPSWTIRRHLKDICIESFMGGLKKKRWFRRYKVRKCYRRLRSYYSAYMRQWKAKRPIHLWRFRDFIRKLSEYSDRKHQLTQIFGEENVFFTGKFSAELSQGGRFQTYFKSGTYTGPGLVDQEMAKGRSPVLPFKLGTTF